MNCTQCGATLPTEPTYPGKTHTEQRTEIIGAFFCDDGTIEPDIMTWNETDYQPAIWECEECGKEYTEQEYMNWYNEENRPSEY